MGYHGRQLGIHSTELSGTFAAFIWYVIIFTPGDYCE